MPRPVREVPWLELRGQSWNIMRYVPGAEGKKGRVVRLGLRTRDAGEAQRRFAGFLATGALDDLDRAQGHAGLSVDDALDQYFAEHVREKVADAYRQEYAIRHLKDYFRGTALADIDIAACRAYADVRRQGVIGGGKRKKGALKKGSDSTIRRELGVLKAAAAHAARWKRIGAGATPPTPMPTFELPAEARNEDMQWLTKAEIAALYAKCDERIALAAMTEDDARWPQMLRDFIVLTYWWGARRGWVETLQVFQVNLETGRVNPYKPGQRKTNKRRGLMPIFDEQRPVIERLLKDRKPNDYLFGSTVDFYRPFRHLCEACGLGDRSNPHILRHSRATHMLMDGENPYKVARLLGDSLQTVERVYGHHSPDFLAETGK